MNDIISSMFARYKCESAADYENALKEIIQEIALLGLWRAKFFEEAAFYGGTALRIFYGLDRFSEDLDFSLLEPNKKFDLAKYCDGVKNELQGFGLSADVKKKEKAADSPIQSAFIKTGTIQNMIMIKTPEQFVKRMHSNQVIKVNFEVDIDPPPAFETEAKYLLQPIPFSVNVYKLPSLFAGKLNAVLYRGWKSRVKGRDWYDLVWFVAKGVSVSLAYFQATMKQGGHIEEGLTRDSLIELLLKKLETIDIAGVKKDVLPIIKNHSAIEVWSKEFFKDVISRISVTK